jgi:hypothetical protein
MDDDSFKQEELEERLKAAEADLAELLESIEEPLEKPEDSGYLVIDQEFRQVIVHWVPQEEVSSIADETEARDKFVQAIEDRDQIDVTRKGDRVVGHGDLMIIHDASEDCNWICYVARVDRTDAYNVGFQGEAPEAGYAESQESNGEVMRELIIWNTCTGEGGGDDCSHDHDVIKITPVVGGTTNVPMPTVSPDGFTTVSVTVPKYDVSTLTTNVNITAGPTESVLKTATLDTTDTTDVLGITGTPAVNPVLLPYTNDTNSVPTGFEVDCPECWLDDDGIYYAGNADDAGHDPCPNPPTDHKYYVNPNDLTPVYEVGIEVCIGGYPCTLTVLATARTGSGSECTALTGDPHGYFFSPIPELTIPIFPTCITPTATVDVPDMNYWQSTDIVTGITAVTKPTVLKTATLDATDTTSAVTSVSGTVAVAVPTITPGTVTVTSTDIPKFIGGFSTVPMPSVTPGTPVNVSGAKKPCVSGNFNFDADDDGAADTTDAFPNDSTQQ